MDTSYALLMNGKRGIGKTFFIKKSVIPAIKQISVRHDERKKYLPVYISLFGVKTIEDIYTTLAIEILPLLRGRKAKAGLSIAKLISRGLLNYNRMGDIDLYKKDFASIAKNTLETKDFVLIFDDLDRISSPLQIGEVIGFINSLVEHDNNKIIIIGDDDQFQNENNYTAVKEKTIGTIVEYATEMSDNFDLIISTKYKDSANIFYEYLKASKADIINHFHSTKTENLRTLIYFLEHFYTIFGELYIGLKLDKERSNNLGYTKMDTVLRFSIAISIEFKNGSINYKDPKGIDDMKTINLFMSRTSLSEIVKEYNSLGKSVPKRDSQRPYFQFFLSQYFDYNYNFYASIYDFITGGNSFSANVLISDLTKEFDDRIYIPSRQEEVFTKLSTQVVYNLSADEYVKLSDELLSFAKAAKYPLDRYISIQFYLQRFPEIKKYSIADITNELIEALRTHAGDFSYDEDLTDKFDPDIEREDSQYYIALYEVINQVNNGNQVIQVEQNRADLFYLFRDTPDQFYSIAKQLFDGPIFDHWSFPAFFTHFKSMPASEIPRFTRFLDKRYEAPIKNRLEYNFISNFFDELAKKTQVTEFKTLREVAERRLLELLHEIIEHSASGFI